MGVGVEREGGIDGCRTQPKVGSKCVDSSLSQVVEAEGEGAVAANPGGVGDWRAGDTESEQKSALEETSGRPIREGK